MTDALSPREEDIALAGEYVLGVLDLSARAAVERRLKADTAFAALVAGWERDFSAMDGGFAELPAPDLLPQIEARLFGKAGPAPRRGVGWLWQLVLGVGAAGLLALLLLTVLPPGQAPRGPAMTATLAAEGQPLAFAASWDAGTKELVVRRTGGDPAAAGQVQELWLIAAEGQAPVSLGLLETAELRRPLDALPKGAVLAVSLEPAGGSPTGSPTGPVLVTGMVGA